VRILRRHPWDVSVAEALRMQARLAPQVDTRARIGPVRLAAGADAAYDDERLVAAVVVLALPDLETVERAWAEGESAFPYVPGLFSFREAPFILRACARLRRRPDVLLCDGQGLAHPRRFGLACHVGYCLDLPTIGCAKTRLVGEHGALGARRGSWAWLTEAGERVGRVVRTRDHVRPVFVSPGFAIGFRDAASIVLRTAAGHRLPEPIRRANALVNALRRGETRGK
jgi:deoxyribonuclease V